MNAQTTKRNEPTQIAPIMAKLIADLAAKQAQQQSQAGNTSNSDKGDKPA